MNQVALCKILTPAEVKRAITIFTHDHKNFHRRVRDELIAPNLARINASVGQENDADYLAYAVEMVFSQFK